jgi:hypothetical protein
MTYMTRILHLSFAQVFSNSPAQFEARLKNPKKLQGKRGN